MIRIPLALGLTLLAGHANAACRHALALGLDVSGSVDAVEYRLQLDGLATALASDAVQQVLFAQPQTPISIAVFEWSGPDAQAMVLPWTPLDDPATLANVTSILHSHQRGITDVTTAIGSAIVFGAALLDTQTHCWKRTLDLSGDGPANTGPRPQDVPDAALPTGVIVNGLVIGSSDASGDDHRQADIKELSSYFRANVIRGPGAFVETARGFSDYAAAMERKLLRELQSLAISQMRSD